ncbi:MAG TPA: GGDEF domain-containing protein [Rectinemataceae bacterium]|nr:GGDEF domain-containing protein [Rectinemataceae bacterium]
MRALRVRFGPLLAYAVFALLALAMLFGMDPLFEPPASALRFEKGILVDYPDGRKVATELSWHLRSTSAKPFSPGLYAETLNLNLPRSSIDPAAEYCLVLPSIGGNGIRVHWNGQFVGSRGDMIEGRSNIWNSVKIFTLDPGTLRPENSVRIEILGRYEAGFIKAPYVIKREGNEGLLFILEFISDSLIWALCGGIAFIGLTLLPIGLTALPRIDSRLLLGIASLFTAVFMIDFLPLEFLPIPLLEFKRLMVLLRHASAALFVLGYLKLLGRKLDIFGKLLLAAQLISIVVLFFPDTMIALKRAYALTYLSIIPFPPYLLALLFVARKAGSSKLLLSGGVAVALLGACRDSIAGLILPGAIMVSHFGFLVMAISTAGYIAMDILQNYRQLKAERSRAERYKSESLHDPLTGAFNRGVLSLVREGLRGPFAVMTLDLDHFKNINDSYGHHVGDRVLLDVVAVMHRVFRRDDWIVRAGGDEFEVFLPDCPSQRVQALTDALSAEIMHSRIAVNESLTITYGASVGSACCGDEGRPSAHRLMSLLDEADAAMYARKNEKAKPASTIPSST